MKQAIYRNYVRLVLLGVSLYLLVSMLFVYWVDPYWIYHDRPPWVEKWGGHNRVLDLKMRFSKSLQVVFQQPKAVILGSSRVYRGMPTDLLGRGDVYNMGISSLRIQEAYAYLQHIIRWTDVSEVVLGLDYFMFDHSMQMESGFDPMVADFKYIFKALPASLVTSMAIDDSLLALKGKKSGDGVWNYFGYKKTSSRSAENIALVLSSFYKDKQLTTESEYQLLNDLIQLAASSDVRLRLFISPLNRPMLNKMKEQDIYLDFQQWIKRVKYLAENSASGTEIFDFSENNPFFKGNVEAGSTEFWIDTSHYSPFVGRWILQQIGFSQK